LWLLIVWWYSDYFVGNLRYVLTNISCLKKSFMTSLCQFHQHVYEKLLHAQIPKAQKYANNLTEFLRFDLTAFDIKVVSILQIRWYHFRSRSSRIRYYLLSPLKWLKIVKGFVCFCSLACIYVLTHRSDRFFSRDKKILLYTTQTCWDYLQKYYGVAQGYWTLVKRI